MMRNKNISDSSNETGIVIKIVDKKAVVELNPQQEEINGKSSCDSCGAKMICIPAGNGKRIINAYNGPGAKAGNKVMVKEDDQLIFKISIYQYAIPLIGFLAGIFGFYSMNLNWQPIPAEVIIFLGGLCGIGVSGIIGKYLISRLITSNKTNAIFSIAKIIH
jgi:positive regulator of sigma E activity